MSVGLGWFDPKYELEVLINPSPLWFCNNHKNKARRNQPDSRNPNPYLPGNCIYEYYFEHLFFFSLSFFLIVLGRELTIIEIKN